VYRRIVTGTQQLDALDDDKRFIELVAEQQQYMARHDALPPESHRISGRRHHRSSHDGGGGGAGGHRGMADGEGISDPRAGPGAAAAAVGGLTQSELDRLEATEHAGNHGSGGNRSHFGGGGGSSTSPSPAATEQSRLDKMVRPPTLVTFVSS
jgi:hypothetical protein